jgi:plasmid stability protein
MVVLCNHPARTVEHRVKSITVKGIPASVLKKLKSRAEAHRRSLNSELLVELERLASEEPEDPVKLLAEIDAARVGMRPLGLTDAEVRRAIRWGRE